MVDYCLCADEAYLPQALALHESMRECCQPCHIWVLALSEKSAEMLGALPDTTLVRLEEVENDTLVEARANRSWLEYIWTVAPSWLLYVLQRVDRAMYMDSDCYFFHSPSRLFELVGGATLAITPHRFPEHARRFEVNGIYNAGVVYATKAGLPAIEEWARQSIDWCYRRIENGKYASQKYLDDWPERWGAYVIQHTGANLAPWNQEAYSYKLEDGRLRVNNLPVLWYHFQRGLEPGWPIHPLVRQTLYAEYEKALCLACSLP